ncbi:MAG: hypothetical protein WBA53_06420 [Burkholderiaceae bacterium]
MAHRLDKFFRNNLSLAPWQAVVLVIAFAVAGAAAGLAFPKWNAEGLLETPGVVIPFDEERERSRDAEPPVKTQFVTLAEYRRVIAAYSSETALGEFLGAAKKQGPAAERLLSQARDAGFWNAVAGPVLPFNRRDAREFGELKDAASNSLVGIDLTTNARTPDLANEMLGTMSKYFANALIRERIRTWVLKNSGEAPAKQKALRAEVVETQMKIESTGRRIQDLKAILARYPDAGKLDSRQVVNIAEGQDRFLPPLAQLVAAEAFITQQRETIARKERQARQFDLMERYFAEVDKKLQATPLASELIPALAALSTAKYEGIDPEAEWAREVVLRLQADIASFSSALASFGIRNDARVAQAPSRDPTRLAAFGAGAAVLLLGLVAFVRASLRASGTEVAEGE